MSESTWCLLFLQRQNNFYTFEIFIKKIFLKSASGAKRFSVERFTIHQLYITLLSAWSQTNIYFWNVIENAHIMFY